MSDLFSGLDKLKGQIVQAAAGGLDTGAQALQSAARASSAYNDQTGATRAGTVAYVGGMGVDRGSVFQAAVDAVQDRNPVAVQVESIAAPVDALVVILTVPTTYQRYLEIERAGVHASIGPALTAQSVAMLEAGADGIRRLFR